MFRFLGHVAARKGIVLLACWILVLIGLRSIAPPWHDVVGDGEFRYLPEDVPSRVAERLFRSAFTKDLLGSSVVIVVRREAASGLGEQDREFIEKELAPRLQAIAEEEGGLTDELDDSKQLQAETVAEGSQRPVISSIRTFSDRVFGLLFDSEDGEASLVMVELTTEFTERRNETTIAKIERLIEHNGELYRTGKVPPGLALALSGSATVGRDMKRAARNSASATETWTILLVVVLLIAIYRAPVLAFIPLATVGVAVSIALKLLSLAAQAGFIELFAGIEIYVTVILYGAGVDFCMFLMARYREELDSGATYEEAITNAVAKVGAALAASAGTTMCGIGMMAFAEFGKFQQAGIAMSCSLFVVLCASLTFAPSLLKLAGRWAFWPNIRTERITSTGGWLSPTSLIARMMEAQWFSGVWEKVGQIVLRSPGKVWLGSMALMLPFAVFGVWHFSFLSYGLLSELPENAPSVVGATAVQQHFPAGATGPATILIENRDVDFRDRNEGGRLIRDLTNRLQEQSEDLDIVDVRSVSHPLGSRLFEKLTVFQRAGYLKRAPEYYVSDKGELRGHVTRVDVVFEDDPFSRNSIEQFDRLKQAVRRELPDELAGSGTSVYYVGPTASIRDLKSVTDRDQISVDMLVIVSVFVILVILLRRPAISAYLIMSVFFSYLVTLGVTFAVFWLLDGSSFAGLDWKVPMFLFTILIAVGQDYNIYLITRVEEESHKYGPVQGVTVALLKTGSIISSCGIIMAGTFSSLMAGYLVGMNQLGFALAFGVLLDTFVVRPILVPAYLILLHSGRFGAFGKLLGAREYLAPEIMPPLKVGADSHEGSKL